MVLGHLDETIRFVSNYFFKNIQGIVKVLYHPIIILAMYLPLSDLFYFNFYNKHDSHLMDYKRLAKDFLVWLH